MLKIGEFVQRVNSSSLYYSHVWKSVKVKSVGNPTSSPELHKTFLAQKSPYHRVCMISHVQLFVTPWTAVQQAPQSIPQQEYWSGLPFPPPRDLPNPGIEPAFPVSVLQADSLPLSQWGSTKNLQLAKFQIRYISNKKYNSFHQQMALVAIYLVSLSTWEPKMISWIAFWTELHKPSDISATCYYQQHRRTLFKRQKVLWRSPVGVHFKAPGLPSF